MPPDRGQLYKVRWIMVEKKNENKGKWKELLAQVQKDKLPEHIAVIMDGNGRWARKRGLPRIAGHRSGMQSLKNMISFSHELGIQVITLFAFSTENWKRPRWEVEFLMRLPEEYLHKELPTLMEKNTVIKAMGDLTRLPESTLAAVENAISETRHNTGMVLNFALNYGGRADILQAVQTLCRETQQGNIDYREIDEALFSSYLCSRGLPDPDLLIRPSGEFRMSNFLLWQMAYTEFWFSQVLWPDFDREHLLQAILDYQNRERRFGGIKSN